MNSEPTPLGPDEAARRDVALHKTAAGLRRALGVEAGRIEPNDRLGAILADSHDEESAGRGPRRWLVPAAAAAAAVVLAGTVWAVTRPTGSTPAAGPTAATEATRTNPTTTHPTSVSPSSVPSPSATGPIVPLPTGGAPTTSVVPPATATVPLPVYYLGPVVGGSKDWRLFREFVPTAVATPATPGAKALAALRQAFGSPSLPKHPGYASPWISSGLVSVTVDGGVITVALSHGLETTPDGGSALAVQQIVWTAQAAVGKGALPVRITVPGDAELAPGVPSTRTWNRPTDPIAVAGVLSPIWVDEPYRGQVVSAGAPLTVKGVASTFEANVEWQLLRDGKAVEQGFTTASIGAPGRGSYTFRTQPIGAGSYLLRVFERSAKDGSVAAEQRVSFTAR
jgi:hypothetical protein